MPILMLCPSLSTTRYRSNHLGVFGNQGIANLGTSSQGGHQPAWWDGTERVKVKQLELESREGAALDASGHGC